MAVTKSTKSEIGAPVQLSQPSRKGKRAWRKNIDLKNVETALESSRVEERITGSVLSQKKDGELFQVDVEGDQRVRKSLPKYSKSHLTSTKILAQRSAVPAVFSRGSIAPKRKSTVSQEDKTRLLRIAKRPRKGPFGALVDHAEPGAGSAMMGISNAVKNSGVYDAWAEEDEEDDDEEMIGLRKKSKPKRPTLPHPRDLIELPAVAEPHQGISYNPPVADHEVVILKVYETEQRRYEESQKYLPLKQKIDSARYVDTGEVEMRPGMKVDEILAEVDVEGEAKPSEEAAERKKVPARKTRQQRTRSKALQAERRALAERAARKRMLEMTNRVKSLRREADKTVEQNEQARLAKQLAEKVRLKQGLAGRKLGKHKVPGECMDVQVSEDLSENLRTLKPEGNIFQDRFRSLQQRALVEPRVRVVPTKQKYKLKEYEKHAWKKFY